MVRLMRVRFGGVPTGVFYRQRNMRRTVLQATVNFGLKQTWMAGQMSRGKARSGTLMLKNLKPSQGIRKTTGRVRLRDRPMHRNLSYHWFKISIQRPINILYVTEFFRFMPIVSGVTQQQNYRNFHSIQFAIFYLIFRNRYIFYNCFIVSSLSFLFTIIDKFYLVEAKIPSSMENIRPPPKLRNKLVGENVTLDLHS